MGSEGYVLRRCRFRVLEGERVLELSGELPGHRVPMSDRGSETPAAVRVESASSSFTSAVRYACSARGPIGLPRTSSGRVEAQIPMDTGLGEDTMGASDAADPG